MMSSSTMASFVTSAMNAPLHSRQTSLMASNKGFTDGQAATTPSPMINKLASASAPLPAVALPPTPAGKINALPKKPMRPLTAYHIFFQIEREFIIQTAAGEMADESVYHNKVRQDDVPQRYRNIRLLPDWYAGPGKKRKRKHRKQHGKIGFLELSRVISTRWAQLEQLDPETKKFVTKIAKEQLDEYYDEMRAYKERTKDLLPSVRSDPRQTAPRKKADKSADNVPSSLQMQHQAMMARPDMVPSYNPQMILPPLSLQISADIDYFISCLDKKAHNLMPPGGSNPNINNMQHLLPPSFNFGDQAQQLPQQVQQPPQQLQQVHVQQHQVQQPPQRLPHQSRVDQQQLQQVPQQVQVQHNKRKAHQGKDVSTHLFNHPVDMRQSGPNKRQRSNPNPNITSPTSAAEVDICDDEIFQLWRESHN